MMGSIVCEKVHDDKPPLACKEAHTAMVVDLEVAD